MKLRWPIIPLLLSSLTVSLCSAAKPSTTVWHHPLYLDNGDFWKQRVSCTVQNNTRFNLFGDPVKIPIGQDRNQLPLEGVLAESVRVTNKAGNQLLYRIANEQGQQIERGPIPKGSTFTVPLEANHGDETDYHIYFDNDSAWAVGEYFYTHREITNQSFEDIDRDNPIGWELEWPEELRDITVSNSEAHSGNHSLKLSSKEAASERTYGALQTDLHLIPSATYIVEAWFKAEDLDADAGIQFTPENLERTKRDMNFEPFILKADSKSNTWSKQTLQFVAPEGSNSLNISTFIEGTGTVYIDDITLTCKDGYDLPYYVKPIQNAPATEDGKTEKWYGEANQWPIRAAITVPNFSSNPLKDQPIYVDVQQLKNRLFDEIDQNTKIQITDGNSAIPHLAMGHGILFKQDIEASTFKTFYIYFSNTQNSSETYGDLSEVTSNLIANPDFSEGELVGWERFGESKSNTIGIEKDNDNPLVKIEYTDTNKGEQIFDIEVSHSTTETAVGLSQSFDVRPGRSYFVSSRVRSSDVLERTYTLRARFLDKHGKDVGDKKSLQANPDMHQNNEWVHDTMIVQAPSGASSVKIELLNTTVGTVWYDDVFFMEIGNGYTGALSVERKAEQDVEGLAIWSKNPLARPFPDDLPNAPLDLINISAAKNDAEAAQILFRSQEAYDDIEIQVSPLFNDNGQTLYNIDIGVIGYVPINYPSNYYRDFVTPFWRTKIPSGKIGSDGWTGWWADPILPQKKFDLPADETKAIWIEIAVSKNASPGHYKGSLQVLKNGKQIREIPINMQVYDFTLPETPSVKATYVPRFNERKMFGRKTSNEENKNTIWQLMADHKISPDTIKPQPTYVVENGEVTLDFTEFDKAAEVYFNDMKFGSIWSPRDLFYLFGWGHAPRERFGEKPYIGEAPYHGIDRSQLNPKFKYLYQSALKQFWDHMKEKGWDDKVVIYISDEPHAEPEIELQMKTLCDMIHEVDPTIKIYVSTWWYRPEFEGYVDVWGVSHRGGGWGHPVPAEHLQEIKKNGGTLFYTTDGMQCTDTPFLGYERMLPYFCFKYEASEYEFWAMNWHTLDPYNYGWHRYHRQSPSADVWYWMRYPNGDGTMVYPGHPIGVDELVTSVRLKQSREGVEDFEFMNTLKNMIEESKANGIDTTNAQNALNRALELVDVPSADGRYTTDYVPDPDLISEIRHAIATEIEALQNN